MWRDSRPRMPSNSALLALSTAIFVFVLSPQRLLDSRFSLLERVSIGLVLLLIILVMTGISLPRIVLPVSVLLLLLVMGLSILQFPALTIVRDYGVFMGITVFAVTTFAAGGAKPLIHGIALASVLLSVSAVLHFLVLPGDSFAEGGFRGTFHGPNSLALSLLVTAPALALISFQRRTSTAIFRATTLLLVFTLIYFSTSRVALVAFVASMIAWGIISVSLKRPRIALGLTLIGFASLVIILLNWASFTNSLGRSSNLTGRTVIWDAYLGAFFQRPLLGHGWQFLVFPGTPFGDEIFAGLPWTPAFIHAHNDLLDWLATTGILGFGLALLILLTLVGLGIKFRELPEARWSFLVGVALIVSGSAEKTMSLTDGWMVAVSASLAVGAILQTFLETHPNTKLRLLRFTFWVWEPRLSGRQSLAGAPTRPAVDT